MRRKVPGRMAVGHPALLADSGYAGLGEVHYELITCKKKPPMGALSQKDVEVNANCTRIASLWRTFGCLKVTFGTLASPYRCSLNSLEDTTITCICLLNLKLRRHPLRAPSGDPNEDSDTLSECVNREEEESPQSMNKQRNIY